MRRFSIDLIICTYNNAVLLERTLEAILQLEVPATIDWGVLVVNNNSTDETTTVVEHYIQNSNLPIRLVTEPEQGLTKARLSGVKNTQRDWIAFIDDDCILARDWIEQAARFLEEHQNCKLFGSRIKLVYEKDPSPFVQNFPYAYAGANHGDSPKKLNAVAGLGMVVSREALTACKWVEYQVLADRVGKKLVSGGDMEIALRVGAHNEIWYNPFCSLEHIITENRLTKRYLQRMLFGLGASRHNVNALKWNGSYSSWLLYSVFYSLGMLVLGIIEAYRKPARDVKGAGVGIALSPFLGWISAIGAMLVMNPGKRKLLLGCARR